MITFFKKLFKRGDFMTRADKWYYSKVIKTWLWSAFAFVIIAWVGTNLVLCALTTNVKSGGDLIYEAAKPITLPTGKELRNIIAEGTGYTNYYDCESITFDYYTSDKKYEKDNVNLIEGLEAENVITNQNGSVELYRDADTNIYILSNCQMFANPDSSFSFHQILGSVLNCKIMLNNYNTSNVTNMSYMFGCDKASSGYVNRTAPVGELNTSKVTNMSGMFSGNEAADLNELGGSSWNTSKVINMEGMFVKSDAAKNVDFYKWDVSSVRNMNSMFADCRATTLDLSTWKVVNCNTEVMFSGCIYLTSLILNKDAGSWKLSGSLYIMFSSCKKLSVLDLCGFDTSSATNMEGMFQSCNNLTTIYASANFVTTNVINDASMFNGCSKLQGGKGTKYSFSHINKTYARIDGGPNSATPGYFTEK